MPLKLSNAAFRPLNVTFKLFDVASKVSKPRLGRQMPPSSPSTPH